MKGKPVPPQAQAPKPPRLPARPSPARNGADKLPPHSPEAEAGILGCCLLAPDLVLKECKFVRSDLFYDLRHATIWDTLKRMADKGKVIDIITVQQALKDAKKLDGVGGIPYLSQLADSVPSAANLSYYLAIAREKYSLRKTVSLCTETVSRIYNWEGNVEELLMGIRSDVDTVTSLSNNTGEPALKVWTLNELKKWEEPKHLLLVGDNEICMGYEGVTLIAGPGSSGKSLVAASLALAGAIGSGTWMGRKVHRKFRTLIVQAENGRSRMKKELETMERNHPDININDSIFISQPPEGGLAFHRPEFRADLRAFILKIKPSVVILDTWAAVSADDAAKDVMDKLMEIRSCFPSGDECPALVIIAHTKKPRPEEVRRGRSLTFSVSGSVALPNTARCVYMLLPWSDETDDARIYWCCSKLNNGQMYPPSVWIRKLGTFFEHDPSTDPRNWEKDTDERPDNRAIKPEDLATAFGSEHQLTKSTLAKRLSEKIGVGYSTVMAVITPGKRGYLADCLEITAEGWVRLKKG